MAAPRAVVFLLQCLKWRLPLDPFQGRTPVYTMWNSSIFLSLTTALSANFAVIQGRCRRALHILPTAWCRQYHNKSHILCLLPTLGSFLVPFWHDHFWCNSKGARFCWLITIGWTCKHPVQHISNASPAPQYDSRFPC